MIDFKKIDKIIYPHDNGTASWWKRNRYDVVVGNTTYYIFSYHCIRLLEVLMDLDNASGRNHDE